jgi:hypothetical protein
MKVQINRVGDYVRRGALTFIHRARWLYPFVFAKLRKPSLKHFCIVDIKMMGNGGSSCRRRRRIE